MTLSFTDTSHRYAAAQKHAPDRDIKTIATGQNNVSIELAGGKHVLMLATFITIGRDGNPSEERYRVSICERATAGNWKLSSFIGGPVDEMVPAIQEVISDLTTTEGDTPDYVRAQMITARALDVVEAFTNKGPMPRHHDSVQAALRQNWPTLYTAINRLVHVEESTRYV